MISSNTKKTKILFYSDCIYFSGSENVIVNLINNDELQKTYKLFFAFWANDLYLIGMEGKFQSNVTIIPLRILSNGSTILFNLKSERSIWETASNFIHKVLNKLLISDIYNFIRLYILFTIIKPSIIYINNGGYPGAESCRIAVFSAKIAGIKSIIFNVNNLANDQVGYFDRLKDKFIAQYVTKFITASNAAKQQLYEKRMISLNKIINIPNTVPKDFENIIEKNSLKKEFNINNDTKIIGSVGLLTKRKGYDVLLDAINMIKTKDCIPNFLVFIFGKGEERKILENQIQKFNLKNTVFLPGFRSNIQNFIYDFDIFILPSIDQEDFPYAILEAMALGKPVIGTKIAGIPEQIEDGYNGYIVEPQNSIQMAEAISNLIADNNKILQMGQNSRNRFNELYKYPIVIEQYISLFKKIIGDN